MFLLTPMLGSCSYVYDVLAVDRGGYLTFEADGGGWLSDRNCVREIEVADEREPLAPVWSVDTEDRRGCPARFPLRYGNPFAGKPDADHEQVEAQPLRRKVVYTILSMSSGSGYGGGRFVIHADGRVENLGRR